MKTQKAVFVSRLPGPFLIAMLCISLISFSADRESNHPLETDGVPVGAIMAFGGPPTLIPKTNGWLLCDGSIVRGSEYPLLLQRLGYSWGQGATPQEFRLPDLRGRFLRGVDLHTSHANRDPDSQSRVPSYPGGNSGNRVVSIQEDQFAFHSHALTGSAWAVSPGVEGTGQYVRFFASKSPDETAPEYANDLPVNASGGSETRPKNAYVHWMIKAR